MKVKHLVTFLILLPAIFGGADMTQKSYPWPGVAPANGVDAGNYTAREWWAIFAASSGAGGVIVPDAATPLRTKTELADIGVYHSVDSQLEITTSAVSLNITIAKGAALVDGAFYYNDDDYTITLPPNTTDGYVVLRKNYTGVDYTPGVGTGTVPAYTIRPTWVSALTQNTDDSTYWDLPLLKFTTDASGVTAETDEREYVEGKEKQFLVNPSISYNVTDAVNLSQALTIGAYLPYIYSGHSLVSQIGGSFYVPSDFISDMTIEVVYRVATATIGNYYVTFTVDYGAEDEDRDTHTTTRSDALASPANKHNKVEQELSLSDITAGDFITFEVQRDSTNVNDTLNTPVYLVGFLVKYVGMK